MKKVIPIVLMALFTACISASSTSGGKSSLEATTKQKISQKTHISKTHDIEITSTIIEIPIKHMMSNPNMQDDEVNKIIQQQGHKNTIYKDGVLTIKTPSISLKDKSSNQSNTDAINETLFKLKTQINSQANSSFNMQMLILLVVVVTVVYVLFKVGIVTFKAIKK